MCLPQYIVHLFHRLPQLAQDLAPSEKVKKAGKEGLHHDSHHRRCREGGPGDTDHCPRQEPRVQPLILRSLPPGGIGEKGPHFQKKQNWERGQGRDGAVRNGKERVHTPLQMRGGGGGCRLDADHACSKEQKFKSMQFL